MQANLTLSYMKDDSGGFAADTNPEAAVRGHDLEGATHTAGGLAQPVSYGIMVSHTWE